MSAGAAKTIVLAAGGTGGHLFPAQALAHELLERGHSPVLITDAGSGGFGPDLGAQVPRYTVPAAGVMGRDPVRKGAALAKLAAGYVKAGRLLRRLRPDTVVGFGGYGALPTVLAAEHAGRRVVLHEQNAVAGRANRVLARRAQAVALGFPEVRGLATGASTRVLVTGNPVRSAIADVGSEAYPPSTGTAPLNLLVIGGSQGARAFNTVVPKAVTQLPEAVRSRLYISQQVRGGDTEAVRAAYADAGVAGVTLRAFFDDMPARLRDAHLVVARAGASTVTELAAAGRPAILVPFPYAADDHQSANAAAFEEAGGGWVMPQPSLTDAALAERLGALFAHPESLADAAAAAHAFGCGDSAARLADVAAREDRAGVPVGAHAPTEVPA